MPIQPGMAKNTYGTGSFLLMQTGTEAPVSKQRLLTTIAWRLGDEPVEYALEGAVFVSGAAVQWLRDGLGLIESSADVEQLAAQVNSSEGVVFVPALAWRMGYRDKQMMWISLGFAFAVVILFKSLLGVKIPGGAIYEYLRTVPPIAQEPPKPILRMELEQEAAGSPAVPTITRQPTPAQPSVAAIRAPQSGVVTRVRPGVAATRAPRSVAAIRVPRNAAASFAATSAAPFTGILEINFA